MRLILEDLRSCTGSASPRTATGAAAAGATGAGKAGLSAASATFASLALASLAAFAPLVRGLSSRTGAAALFAANAVKTFNQGIVKVKGILKSGKVLAKLEEFKKLSNQ